MADPDLPSPPDPVIPNAARVKVVIPSTSGIPRDSFVNTFHFHAMPAVITDAMFDALVNYVAECYNDIITPAARSVASYMGDAADRTLLKCKMNCYRLGDSHPRVPYVKSWTLAAGVGTDNGMPPEVAFCISYHDTHVSGAKTRFGRTYIGPLRSTVTAGASPHVAPDGQLRVAAVAFGNRLKDLGTVTTLPMHVEFGILSRLHANINSVTGGFVDNEFDTQRRRGQRATLRDTF